jgi:hypothetical protein
MPSERIQNTSTAFSEEQTAPTGLEEYALEGGAMEIGLVNWPLLLNGLRRLTEDLFQDSINEHSSRPPASA